jgi:hypothetical protein
MHDNDSGGIYDPHDNSSTDQRPQAFERGGMFVLGVGDSLDDLQVNGAWVSTDSPIDLEGSR